MKVRIESNFVIPGLQDTELDFNEEKVTLRRVLDEISQRSQGEIVFFGTKRDHLDVDEWEVEVNGVPHYACSGQLETSVSDGDLVTIRIVILGGG